MLSQIRNHFIFNTLGVISGYCKVDPEKADEALARFARYLRRNMHYLEEKGLIPFETEVAQIEDYVTKPGRKGSVCLLTHREPDSTIIEVIDDGIGFSPEELDKDTSIGIRNIRYRLEHMAGAQLQIDSALGKGTKAIIRIPVETPV